MHKHTHEQSEKETLCKKKGTKPSQQVPEQEGYLSFNSTTVGHCVFSPLHRVHLPVFPDWILFKKLKNTDLGGSTAFDLGESRFLMLLPCFPSASITGRRQQGQCGTGGDHLLELRAGSFWEARGWKRDCQTGED